MALAAEMRRLTDALRQTHQGRSEAVEMLRGDADRYLTDQLSARRHMASALARDLDEASAVRRTAESDRRRVQMAHTTRQRAAYLRSVRSSLQSMRSSVASMRTSLASTRAATASALKELRNDVDAAHRAWTEFDLSMRRARAAAADSSAIGRPADTTPAEPLSERVIRYLGEHPMGQRLGELQKAFGAPRRQLTRLMDELVEARKARLDKQGLYLARR